MTGEGTRDPYQLAGVDIEEADRTVPIYKELAESTPRKGVLSEIGHFAGLFELPKMKDPVLVSGTDGVGTKLLLAKALGRLSGVGQDMVAMVVNDLLCIGARPLFLLDYLATSRLDADEARALVSSVAGGCREAGCALLGGETAELPGMLMPDAVDLAGFGVGVVERDLMVTGAGIRPGDRILALSSSGFHSNGFTLVRKIVADAKLDLHTPFGGGDLGDALLSPTRIYVNSVVPILGPAVHGLAHVTGGGIGGNLVRILPDGVRAEIRSSLLPEPPVMTFIREKGGISRKAARPSFNLGAGFLVVLHPDAVLDVKGRLEAAGESVQEIGSIFTGGRTVQWID